MPARIVLNRHHLHIAAYFFVALCLMIIGCIFSAFAIFVKDSELGKVWLAGPTTIAVGLVLCGKVIIDCRPPPDEYDEDEDDSFICDEETEFAYMYKPVEEQQTPVITKETDVITCIDAAYQQHKIKHTEPTVIENSCSFNNSAIWNPRSDVNSTVMGVSPMGSFTGASSGSTETRCTEHTRCMCKEMNTTPMVKRPRSASAVQANQYNNAIYHIKQNPRRAGSVKPHKNNCSNTRNPRLKSTSPNVHRSRSVKDNGVQTCALPIR